MLYLSPPAAPQGDCSEKLDTCLYRQIPLTLVLRPRTKVDPATLPLTGECLFARGQRSRLGEASDTFPILSLKGGVTFEGGGSSFYSLRRN